MDSLTFGQFLLKEGLADYAGILKARMFQKKNSRKLGDIAISLGMLTEEQVERILSEQTECGIAFGQIALRDHLLTAPQLDAILTEQAEYDMDFDESLVAVGVLTKEVLAENLDKYKAFSADFGRSADDHWYKVLFNGRLIDVDADGFLRNRCDWSEDYAAFIAEKDGVILTEGQLEVLRFIREYYNQHELTPMPKLIVKAMNKLAGREKYTIKSLCEMFHESSIRKACQLAGIPKPPGCT